MREKLNTTSKHHANSQKYLDYLKIIFSQQKVVFLLLFLTDLKHLPMIRNSKNLLSEKVFTSLWRASPLHNLLFRTETANYSSGLKLHSKNIPSVQTQARLKIISLQCEIHFLMFFQTEFIFVERFKQKMLLIIQTLQFALAKNTSETSFKIESPSTISSTCRHIQ